MIELVKIRTENQDPDTVIDQINAIMNELAQEKRFTVHRHYIIPTDFLVTIHHEEEVDTREASDVSQFLRFQVRDLGMSSYSKWVEVNAVDQDNNTLSGNMNSGEETR